MCETLSAFFTGMTLSITFVYIYIYIYYTRFWFCLLPQCYFSGLASDSLFTKFYNKEGALKSGKHVNVSKQQH